MGMVFPLQEHLGNEYHQVTPCNKLHTRDLLRRGAKARLPLTRKREQRAGQKGRLLYGFWSMISGLGGKMWKDRKHHLSIKLEPRVVIVISKSLSSRSSQAQDVFLLSCVLGLRSRVSVFFPWPFYSTMVAGGEENVASRSPRWTLIVCIQLLILLHPLSKC